MIFNDDLKLLSSTIEVDEYKQQISNEVPIEVACYVRSVHANESNTARINKLNPTRVFGVRSFEYNDEEFLIYNEDRYKVIRPYWITGKTIVELTCEKIKHE